jgi:hypothetical protein
MNETTNFLVDFVIADVPVRRWALTFPQPLRYLLADEAALCTRGPNIFVGVVFTWQRRLAKRELALNRAVLKRSARLTNRERRARRNRYFNKRDARTVRGVVLGVLGHDTNI